MYFVKGACQEELVMQGRGKDAQVWLDSFYAVTPCIVQEVRSCESRRFSYSTPMILIVAWRAAQCLFTNH